ncbi:uncharacterized protein [Penaeus vannamei]|uniref:MADF domain-containing protein n=1 Tax=Penaeus vannamei TaxID=6689 RepID=A0A3R7MYS8_PENVA|nr:uncharacterized protein LOC113810154 [Penaeus vannamei]ROT72933.1 hypothetical protein C7M84_008659 [Penaeus vannamei]
MAIVWSPGLTKSLLEKIRTREVLWDTNHRFFSKKNLRRSCFDQVCMELKSEHKHLHALTTDDVVQRFQYLRGHFQKLLRKIKNSPNGSGAQTPAKWEFFNSCLFMQPIYDNVQSQSSFTPSDDMMEMPCNGVVVYEGLLEKDSTGNEDRVLLSPSSSVSSPSPLPDLPEDSKESFHKPSVSSTPSPLPDLPEIPPESRNLKRKRTWDEMEENLMESINCVKEAWSSQSQNQVQGKPFRYDMATEAVMSCVEFLSSHKDLKMEFIVEVMSLVNRTVKKVQERESKQLHKNNQIL